MSLIKVICLGCGKMISLRVRIKGEQGFEVPQGYCSDCYKRKISEIEALQKGEGPKFPRPKGSQGTGAF